MLLFSWEALFKLGGVVVAIVLGIAVAITHGSIMDGFTAAFGALVLGGLIAAAGWFCSGFRQPDEWGFIGPAALRPSPTWLVRLLLWGFLIWYAIASLVE